VPRTPWGPYQNDLASGLFGTFQESAAAGLDTQTVWEKLREAAGSWQWSTSGRGGEPSPEELQDVGRGVLSDQGIEGRVVGEYRKIAGEWLGAKERLGSLEPQSQIRGQHIWQPPWAQTTDPNVPSEYRARAQWQMTPTSGDSYTLWKTYELQTPLTSRGDIEGQVEGQQEDNPYLALLSGGAPPSIANIEIEQV
jgi:hypothetical protein